MNNPFITQSLSEFCNSHLRDETNREIDWVRAKLISAILITNPDCITWHVEFPSIDNNNRLPLLWHRARYLESVEYRTQLRKESEREREKYYIFNANLPRLGKCICRALGVDKDFGMTMARRELTMPLTPSRKLVWEDIYRFKPYKKWRR